MNYYYCTVHILYQFLIISQIPVFQFMHQTYKPTTCTYAPNYFFMFNLFCLRVGLFLIFCPANSIFTFFLNWRWVIFAKISFNLCEIEKYHFECTYQYFATLNPCLSPTVGPNNLKSLTCIFCTIRFYTFFFANSSRFKTKGHFMYYIWDKPTFC